MGVTNSAVDMSIERIVLDGFGELDGTVAGAALEREFARLVGERGIPTSWREPGIRAGFFIDLDWDGTGDADALGSVLATRLYEGLSS